MDWIIASSNWKIARRTARRDSRKPIAFSNIQLEIDAYLNYQDQLTDLNDSIFSLKVEKSLKQFQLSLARGQVPNLCKVNHESNSRFLYKESFIVNLISAFIVIVGGFVFYNMKRDIQPAVNIPIVFVTGSIYGASPEQMERQVTYPIEEAFQGLPEIKKMTSTSYQGFTRIVLRLDVKPDDYLNGGR